MNEPDPLIREYYHLQPTQFSVFTSLTISQAVEGNGICEQSLSFVLSKELNGGSPSLYLTFRGVRNLVFQQPDWSEISIGHLEILRGDEIPNISSRYLVRDPEQERIVWFECMDFDATIR